MILNIHEIKPGMTLEHSIISPENGACLLMSGTTLSINNIEKIRELKIEEIHIADRYSVFISPNDMMAGSLASEFIGLLRKTCPKRPEANKNDKVVEIAKQLQSIIMKISRNEDILSLLVEQKLVNNIILYETSLYAAVLSGIVAGCMNLSTEDIICTVAGALLHDIGMCEMPMIIGLDNLTGQKEKLLHEHPTYGYYFAVQKNIPRKIAECIQYHHEKWNGTGYPKGIKEHEIPINARIVSVCSHYAAAVTYKKVPPYMAIEELYGTSGMFYDYEVVKAFINNIPIYPLGQIVRLSTKEVGIVANIRKNEGPRPIVKIYYNRVNRPISEDKVIDLGKERTIFIEEIL